MDHARYASTNELELVRQFVNTRDVEEGTDDLAGPDALRTWFEQRGFDPGRVGVTDVDRAVELREALRALLLANGGASLDARAIETLNSIADEMHLTVRFDGSGNCGLEPAGDGSEAALGELLAIVFRAMSDGSWARLKACREDTCQWAFYDRSRNRSGTWCSMEVCGNRAKARAYRRRHSGGS
jgi:predicted RNA-binding Zn ribbon-like protein